MLDYEWGNPTGMMLPGEEPEPAHHHGPDPARQPFLDHYDPSAHPAFADHHQFLANHPHHHHDLSSAAASHSFPHFFGGANNNNNNPSGQALHHHHHHSPLYDPRAFSGASPYAPMLSLEAGAQFLLVPKAEEEAAAGLCRPSAAELIGGSSARIGLNLGGRTYFSSAEDDFMSRLYRRPRAMEVPSANSPRCQAEGCNADLSHAKHYHRRHKVCEFHSKASTVFAAGLTQRFCQQCSRFHLLSEFDNGKRSCRKRLADHNRRRRKTQQQPNQDNPKPSSSSQLENSRTNPSSDHSVARSPPDSGAQSSSSVTVAVSPPRMSLDCFRQRSTYQTTASSGSSSSLFFSSG